MTPERWIEKAEPVLLPANPAEWTAETVSAALAELNTAALKTVIQQLHTAAYWALAEAVDEAQERTA